MRTKLCAITQDLHIENEPMVVPAGLPVELVRGRYVVTDFPKESDDFWYWEQHGIELGVHQVEEGKPTYPPSESKSCLLSVGGVVAIIVLAVTAAPVSPPAGASLFFVAIAVAYLMKSEK